MFAAIHVSKGRRMTWMGGRNLRRGVIGIVAAILATTIAGAQAPIMEYATIS